MASLLTTGRKIKGSALGGLSAAARDEAAQNIAEEQLEQAKKAQQAQLLGTGIGIGGASLIMQGGTAAATGAGAGAAASQTVAQQLAQSVPATLGIAPSSTAAAATTQAGAGAGAGAAGGATALLTNPMTWAVVAGLYVLKNIFD